MPPTLTTILTGNGDIPEALVMTGTAARPCSEEVCVIIICRVADKVEARVALKIWRSVCDVGHHHENEVRSGPSPRSDLGWRTSALIVLPRNEMVQQIGSEERDHCSHGISSSPT